MKVCIRPGIISLRGPETDWNALIEAEDVLLLDTRNIDETKLGISEGTADPRRGRPWSCPGLVDRLLRLRRAVERSGDDGPGP